MSIQSTKKAKFKSTFEQVHDYHEMLQRYLYCRKCALYIRLANYNFQFHKHKVTSNQSTKKAKFKSTFEQVHNYHEMIQRYLNCHKCAQYIIKL